MHTDKFLWVRLDAIGDAILSASMLPHIYEKFHEPRITVVCTDNTAEIYEACPYVEKVIGVEKMRLFMDTVYRNEIVLRLRDEKFDFALDSSCSQADMGDLFLVGSQARRLYAFENRGSMPEDRLNKRRKVFTRLVPFEHDCEPELDRYSNFLKEFGIDAPELKPTVWTTEEDEEYADRVFVRNNLIPEKTVALFAFGRSHLRTYPYYGEALSGICEQDGLSVVALGDSSAFGFNQSCLDNIRTTTVNLCGETTIRQSASILKRCRIAVGAETGLGHLACAVGVPNVIVIGGGHAGRFMPYTPTTSLVTLPLECFDCDWTCRYQKAHCVIDISPDVLEFAVRETLRVNSEKPRMFVEPQSRWIQGSGMPAWKMAGKFFKYDKLDIVEVESDPAKQRIRSTKRNSRSQDKPPAVGAALERAKSLRDAGKIDESLSVLDKAIRDSKNFPDLMNMKAELFIQAGRLEEAKEILWKTILNFPFDVQALNNVVVIEIMQERYESALGLLKRVLDIDPDNQVALSNLGYIENGLLVRSKLASAEQCILKGEFKSARRSLNEIFEAYPNNEDALTDLAIVEAQEGNNGEALKILQVVLAGNTHSDFAAQMMEKLLLK